VRFIHTVCGGDIDTKTKTCTRCKKHWNLFTWWMTATEIRPIAEVPTRKIGDRSLRVGLTKKSGYAGWMENRLPGVAAIASRLPNWPRWARLLATLVVLGIVVVIVLLVRC